MGSCILQSPNCLHSLVFGFVLFGFVLHAFLYRFINFGFMLFGFVGSCTLQIVWVRQFLASCCLVSEFAHSPKYIGSSNFSSHWLCEFLDSHFVEVFRLCGFLRFFLLY